jgi:RNA polymerase sigma-70 factor (ECF subfamily)
MARQVRANGSAERRVPADEQAFLRALAGARAGQALGFEWLWHRFSRQVTAFARLQGSEDPEGVANDVFAAAFGRILTFSGGSNAFVSFVFSIARNKIIDERRKRRRRVITAAFDGGSFDREVLEAGGLADSAETDALAGLAPATADAMRRLTDDQREVVFLRLVADLPIEDVATLTGRSVGAVKAMQHRALASMRREIPRGAVSR